MSIIKRPKRQWTILLPASGAKHSYGVCLLEVATVLLARRGLSVASSVGSVMLQAREVDFVPCSEIFLDTLETFLHQSETALSFADAAIVTAARRFKAETVATFDREFDKIKGIKVVP